MFDYLKKLIKETPIEIFICAFIGVIISFFIFYSNENIRTKTVPIGYSEIEIINKEAQLSGEQIGELTKYITSTNDSIMDIFDAWNRAQRNGGGTHQFSLELDYKTDKSFKIDIYTLNDRLNIIQEKTPIIKKELYKFYELHDDIVKLNNLLENTWAENHIDHYRTEIYLDTETYTDANGHLQTRSITKTKQVYVNTTHIYTYNKENGEKSSELISNIVVKYEDIKLPEKIRVATKTTADNEYSAERGRNMINLSESEMLDISGTWRDSSVIINNIFNITEIIPILTQNSFDWDVNKKTAKSTSYITFSTIDSGPKEFQSFQRLLNNSINTEKYLFTIIDIIGHNVEYSGVLKDKIKRFISIEMSSAEGDTKKIQKEILKTSTDFYNKNFVNGFEISRFRIHIVIFGTFIGLVTGIIIGIGLEFLGRKIYK